MGEAKPLFGWMACRAEENHWRCENELGGCFLFSPGILMTFILMILRSSNGQNIFFSGKEKATNQTNKSTKMSFLAFGIYLDIEC